MNRNGFLSVAIVTVITLTACNEKKGKQNAETESTQQIEQVEDKSTDMINASFDNGKTENVFHNYQQIRRALVKSDNGYVQQAAKDLAVNYSGDEGLKSKVIAMADTDDIEKQRLLFSELTEAMEPMFRESMTAGTIYKQYCPMAFDGKGGYWISDVAEIRNPYYGQKMLTCGKVVEEIE